MKISFHIFLSVTLAIFCLWLYFLQNNNLNHPSLCDSDCYMRLLRVEQLHDTGDWLDNTIQRSNVPYGDTLHWSRLLDILLLIGAYPGSFFMPFSTALFWWGVFISPVLLAVSIVGLYWAARAFLDPFAAAWTGMIFFFQVITMFPYEFGRPDHHSLLLLLFILLIGFVLRMLSAGSLRHAYLAGAVAAAGMWISPEMLAPIALVCGTLLLLWIVRGKHYLKAAEDFLFALSAGTLIFAAIERSIRYVTVIEYDKMSFVHIVIFFALWGAVRFIRAQAGQTFTKKCITSFLTLLFVLIGLILVFPGLARGPYAAVDPLVISVWMSKDYEAMPVYTSKPAMVMMLTGIFLMLPYAVLPLLRRRPVDVCWVFLNLGVLFFSGLTWYQNRFIPNAQVMMVFPTAYVLHLCLLRIKQITVPFTQSVVRILMITVILLGPIAAAMSVAQLDLESKDEHIVMPASPQYALDQFLEQWQQPQIILAGIYFGAQILYETKHEVIAAPYHRSSGILYLHRVMTAATDAEAYALLQERKVNLIVLYPNDPKSPEYHLIADEKDEDIFYNRLVNHQNPDWLQPVVLPETIGTGWLVFEVKQ